MGSWEWAVTPTRGCRAVTGPCRWRKRPPSRISPRRPLAGVPTTRPPALEPGDVTGTGTWVLDSSHACSRSTSRPRRCGSPRGRRGGRGGGSGAGTNQCGPSCAGVMTYNPGGAVAAARAGSRSPRRMHEKPAAVTAGAWSTRWSSRWSGPRELAAWWSRPRPGPRGEWRRKCSRPVRLTRPAWPAPQAGRHAWATPGSSPLTAAACGVARSLLLGIPRPRRSAGPRRVPARARTACVCRVRCPPLPPR